MSKTVYTPNVAASEFVKTFRQLISSRSDWEVWADFVSMFAATLSNRVDKENAEKREAEYLSTIKKYSPNEQEVFPELCCITINALEFERWQDFLGSLYMALDLGNHWKGQFFTPYSVTQAMAKISAGSDLFGIVKKRGYVTVNDCACGAGATLIAAAEIACNELSVKHGLNWQNHVLFTAQDIDPVTAKMCYIQLSLLGCAGYVKIGDSLSDPMREGDDNSKYWYTPMWFSECWQFRRIARALDKLFAGAKASTRPEAASNQSADASQTKGFTQEDIEQLTLF